ncbi:nucleocapsid protein [Mammarenavirus okahandjaense]|uniref:Nucleoprotein n=1 Tax=Mammarenavirus okahandjaense TaxID=3052321 RepID=A0A0H3VDG5_9VIRU|nr:nucleocapsid protein [Mammarenavirus okahandjaense]AJZ76771.1 nucleocapsid protein [Mammarenavirus okahandjaense]
MANSKEIKSFQWTMALRRELSQYTSSVKVQVLKDAQMLLHSLDFSEVVNVQRMMRKDKRDDSDLKRLRDLNQTVNGLVELKSTQQKNVLKVGRLSSDELLALAADIEKLKIKVTRTERPQSAGVYMGNLTGQQLEQRTKLLNLIGMNNNNRTPPSGIVRVWDIKDSSLLNNQFGTMPSLTLACMTKQGQTDLSDVVHALTDLGLIYTAKYPNMTDLHKLIQTHPVLGVIQEQQPSINISGYNLSLSAAVKAASCLIDGGNMLETIRVTPQNIESILQGVLRVKKQFGMFISEAPGDRNPYENILYKICLSGNGWPYISSRTSIIGRAWDNTVIDLSTSQPPKVGKTSSDKPNQSMPLAGLTFSQLLLLKDLMAGLDPNARTWIDIEGRANDPVEIALYQPANGQCIHFYREPSDVKQFKQDSKFSHGIDLTDLFSAQPGLTSAVIENLPQNMVLTCQGASDIEDLLRSQGKGDIKVIDVSLSKEQSRQFEDAVWDLHKNLCRIHTGVVVMKTKKGKVEVTPHCALMDCLMFEAATNGGTVPTKVSPLLPSDLVFRTQSRKVTL